MTTALLAVHVLMSARLAHSPKARSILSTQISAQSAVLALLFAPTKQSLFLSNHIWIKQYDDIRLQRFSAAAVFVADDWSSAAKAIRSCGFRHTLWWLPPHPRDASATKQWAFAVCTVRSQRYRTSMYLWSFGKYAWYLFRVMSGQQKRLCVFAQPWLYFFLLLSAKTFLIVQN